MYFYLLYINIIFMLDITKHFCNFSSSMLVFIPSTCTYPFCMDVVATYVWIFIFTALCTIISVLVFTSSMLDVVVSMGVILSLHRLFCPRSILFIVNKKLTTIIPFIFVHQISIFKLKSFHA